MGSFRSLADRRTKDTDVLTNETCSALEPGESIRYWTRLPHGARAKVDQAGSVIVIGTAGEEFRYDPVARGRTTLREGIIEMTLLDEEGRSIHWDYARADELLDGMPPAALAMLGTLIDSERPPRLSDKVDDDGEPLPADADPETVAQADTVGNA